MEEKNLVRLRHLRKLSQSQLAKKAGVSKRAIESYEQGVRDINAASGIVLWRLARALNCLMEELLEMDSLNEYENSF